MESVYLSPAQPRSQLRTEVDLRLAIENGILSESHFLDLKRLIPPGRTKNVELARDLASFAIDGGTILVGIGEHEDGSLTLDPVELHGLAERVDQVAAFGIDPPLSVVTNRIPATSDTSRGYLLIHIPPSAVAPHAVDGRYVGRGDTTKRYLTDPEVMRLHERRLALRGDAEKLVRNQFARDPLSHGQRQAHLFVVAEPLAAREDMLVPMFDAGQWQVFAVELLQSAIHDPDLNARLRASRVTEFSPDMDTLQSFDLRAAGVALTSYGMTTGRKIRAEAVADETVAELEIGNSGTLRAYMSRMSDSIGRDEHQYVLDSAPVAYVRRMLALAVKVSERAAYFGPWALGVGVTGLADSRSWLHHERGMSAGPTYDENEYVRTADATYLDMRDHPGALTSRLLGSLLRTFRLNGVFEGALTDPAPPQ